MVLRPELVEMLFEEMIRSNTTRVWIASDVWSRSTDVAKMKDINKVGGVSAVYIALMDTLLTNMNSTLTLSRHKYLSKYLWIYSSQIILRQLY